MTTELEGVTLGETRQLQKLLLVITGEESSRMLTRGYVCSTYIRVIPVTHA